MGFDPVSYLMGQKSGGGSSQPESIDLWELKTLASMSKTYKMNFNGNTNIQVTKLNDSMLFHVSGTFSGTGSVIGGWNISKSDAASFSGKFLNLKMSGTMPQHVSVFRGMIEANVDPWDAQADVTPDSRKCLISSMPDGSYDSVVFGIQIKAQAGDTVDIYIELTITED